MLKLHITCSTNVPIDDNPQYKALVKHNHCSHFEMYSLTYFSICTYVMLVHILYSFIFPWVAFFSLIYKNSLCVPDINPLPVLYFSNIFSPLLREVYKWLTGVGVQGPATPSRYQFLLQFPWDQSIGGHIFG